MAAAISVALVVLSLALLVLVGRRSRDAEAFTRVRRWQVLVGLATPGRLRGADARTIGFEIPALVLSLVWLQVPRRRGLALGRRVLSVLVVARALRLVFVGALLNVPHPATSF